ncbi:unnamed protein product, partial [Durusdinium trenchii]
MARPLRDRARTHRYKLRRILGCLGLFISCALSISSAAFLPTQRRRALAYLFAVSGQSARAEEGQPGVDIYFGQGCFWHVQREMVLWESKFLGRSGGDITSMAGYAGGQLVKKQPVCYHNVEFPARDYAKLGHAEVVKVSSIPEDKVAAFAKAYLDSVAAEQPAGRPDPQDVGAEYRAMIGLSGGSSSPLFKDIAAANADRLKLAVGQGLDPDTAQILAPN